jgi:hypothetical protein
MRETKTLGQRIVQCTLDLVQVEERLRESQSNLEGNVTEREEMRLQGRKTELLNELEMLSKMRRIDHSSARDTSASDSTC